MKILANHEFRVVRNRFQTSGYRNFKTFYNNYVRELMRRDFPRVVSYNRFVEWEADGVVSLAIFMHTRFGQRSTMPFHRRGAEVSQSLRREREKSLFLPPLRKLCETSAPRQ
ncbi:MAG: hypothetical protein HOP19_03150 [Acidobacteria bacterium]|nr:hypothetical protein [Acidobacteriota bacterium]